MHKVKYEKVNCGKLKSDKIKLPECEMHEIVDMENKWMECRNERDIPNLCTKKAYNSWPLG